MRGYNTKLAKKLKRLRQLIEKLHKELPEEHRGLKFGLKFALTLKDLVYSIATFPNDTYNVILSEQGREVFKKVSSNTKRAVIVDNRDSMVAYDKEKGYLFDEADLPRNKFATVLFSIWDTAKLIKDLDRIPENLQPLIREIDGLLVKWRKFAEGYKQIEDEEAEESINQYSEVLEAYLDYIFKPEVERRKAKKEQRRSRIKLHEKFLKLRPDYGSNQEVYIAMSKDDLAAQIKQFDEIKNDLSYPDGLKMKKVLNDKIKQRAATIKRAVYRGKKDIEEEEKEKQ